jgi:hypothetical protein
MKKFTFFAIFPNNKLVSYEGKAYKYQIRFVMQPLQNPPYVAAPLCAI